MSKPPPIPIGKTGRTLSGSGYESSRSGTGRARRDTAPYPDHLRLDLRLRCMSPHPRLVRR